jgi:hypothetical protein
VLEVLETLLEVVVQILCFQQLLQPVAVVEDIHQFQQVLLEVLVGLGKETLVTKVLAHPVLRTKVMPVATALIPLQTDI